MNGNIIFKKGTLWTTCVRFSFLKSLFLVVWKYKHQSIVLQIPRILYWNKTKFILFIHQIWRCYRNMWHLRNIQWFFLFFCKKNFFFPHWFFLLVQSSQKKQKFFYTYLNPWTSSDSIIIQASSFFFFFVISIWRFHAIRSKGNNSYAEIRSSNLFVKIKILPLIKNRNKKLKLSAEIPLHFGMVVQRTTVITHGTENHAK